MHGETPLLWAAGNGHNGVVKLLLDTAQVDVNAKDRMHGDTPLSAATKNRHGAVVKLLREHVSSYTNVEQGAWQNCVPAEPKDLQDFEECALEDEGNNTYGFLRLSISILSLCQCSRCPNSKPRRSSSRFSGQGHQKTSR